jgi:hypothetical protein
MRWVFPWAFARDFHLCWICIFLKIPPWDKVTVWSSLKFESIMFIKCGLFFFVSLSSIRKRKPVTTRTLKINLRERNFLRHGWLSAGTTWEGNADYPFKQGLLTRGRARFKHGGMLTVNFRQPRAHVILWFELWIMTNPPLGILMM